MGICRCCACICCSAYSLAYISAIIVGVKVAIFGALNIVFMQMHTCQIEPPVVDTWIGPSVKVVWAKYIFDVEQCENVYENYATPDWMTGTLNSIKFNASLETTPQENYKYQETYLIIHCFLLLCCLVLIIGNFKRWWMFYVPFMLMNATVITMDIVIACFYFREAGVIENSIAEVGAAIWMGSFYLKFYLFWLSLIFELLTVMRTFCKVCMKSDD